MWRSVGKSDPSSHAGRGRPHSVPRWAATLLTAMGCLLFLPSAAHAQSAISGLIRDVSGAVLPGVTVEASSPVLIEKSRSVVSDETGRYTLVDLRPGTYKMTFTLSGFSTLVRDGVELPGNTTVPINVELRVGALEESITVSGQTPLVDVQNAQRTQVLEREVIDALPTTRNMQSVGAIVPGVKLSRPDVGGSQGMEQTYMRTHGADDRHTSIQVDGMSVNSANAVRYRFVLKSMPAGRRSGLSRTYCSQGASSGLGSRPSGTAYPRRRKTP